MRSYGRVFNSFAELHNASTLTKGGQTVVVKDHTVVPANQCALDNIYKDIPKRTTMNYGAVYNNFQELYNAKSEAPKLQVPGSKDELVAMFESDPSRLAEIYRAERKKYVSQGVKYTKEHFDEITANWGPHAQKQLSTPEGREDLYKWYIKESRTQYGIGYDEMWMDILGIKQFYELKKM